MLKKFKNETLRSTCDISRLSNCPGLAGGSQEQLGFSMRINQDLQTKLKATSLSRLGFFISSCISRFIIVRRNVPRIADEIKGINFVKIRGIGSRCISGGGLCLG